MILLAGLYDFVYMSGVPDRFQNEAERVEAIRLAKEFCERKGPEMRSALHRLPRLLRSNPQEGAALALQLEQEAKRLRNFAMLAATETATLRDIAEASGLERPQNVHYYVLEALRDPFLVRATTEQSRPGMDPPDLS